ncbi:hypothetical protein [Salinimicrobium terrae]|uniref:hypothetical protein n=1 Tax=Salinimicrobium terrae TaxID=470866 RepID=UPI0012EC1427|nr:hypothetical protein [Salinimicrobium terrae]
MKIFVSLLLLLHAILHLMGLVKAFYRDFLPTLSRKIGRTEGVLWLACTVILVMADVFYLTGAFFWPILSISGALLSQFLITLNWEDAKYGTIVNLLILAVSFPALT